MTSITYLVSKGEGEIKETGKSSKKLIIEFSDGIGKNLLQSQKFDSKVPCMWATHTTLRARTK